MFIAHLPAGYLLAKTIRLRTPGRKAVMTAALLGGDCPGPGPVLFLYPGRPPAPPLFLLDALSFRLVRADAPRMGSQPDQTMEHGRNMAADLFHERLPAPPSGLHRGRHPSPGSVVHALSRAGHCPGAVPPLVAELPAALVFFSGIAHHCRFRLYHGFWQKEDGISLRKSIFYRNP